MKDKLRFVSFIFSVAMISGCAGFGYVDETPCPDGSQKVRHKPRHGPSIFTCPTEAEAEETIVENEGT